MVFVKEEVVIRIEVEEDKEDSLVGGFIANCVASQGILLTDVITDLIEIFIEHLILIKDLILKSLLSLIQELF